VNESKSRGARRMRCKACTKNWVFTATSIEGLDVSNVIPVDGVDYCAGCLFRGENPHADALPDVIALRAKINEAKETRMRLLNDALTKQVPTLPNQTFTVLYTSGTTG
jgi:acyl-coenzyme A synthetase/AMP-(fatty) acid ligase